MRLKLAPGNPLQMGITSCCLVAFILYGYDQGVFSGIQENEDWLDQFGHPSDTRTGIIVSSYNLGCFAGCIVNFLFGEMLGRRKTIWIAMGVVIIGAAVQATSFTVGHLVVGRVVTGIGAGMKTSTVPAYQSELCDHRARGRLVSAEVLFVGIGIEIAYWFDFGMSYVKGSVAWRLPIAFQAVFAIPVIVLIFVLPESPRWLFNHGREQEGIDTLCAIYDKKPTDEEIIAEKRAIIQALELEQSTGTTKSFLSTFKNDHVRTGYRVLLAWFVQFMNQLSGVNLVVYYIPTVLTQNVGMTPKVSQIVGGFVNMMFMVGGFFPTFFLDRLGRRTTMLWGFFTQGISMVMVSVLLSQSESPGQRGHDFASASVAFFFIFMLIFGMTINCVPWVVVPEILPLSARTRGTAIGVSSNWLFNFAVVMISPIIVHRLHWKAYLIFMCTNLAFVPVVYFFYPETGNVQLEEIDLMFSSGRNPVTVGREMAQERKAAGARDTESTAVSSSSDDKNKVVLLETVS